MVFGFISNHNTVKTKKKTAVFLKSTFWFL